MICNPVNLLQPQSHDLNQSTDVFHSKVQFLAIRYEFEIKIYLYGDLEIILRFHKNKYTIKSQLQSNLLIGALACLLALHALRACHTNVLCVLACSSAL